jgi:hypothetical protein
MARDEIWICLGLNTPKFSEILMNQSPKSFLEYTAVAAILFTFFAYFSVQIWDIDFWWHIAAGRETWAQGAIPSVDPFGVYDANNVWGQTVLKSQWLGQVMLYAVYRAFDLDGIIWLRAALLTLCLGVLYMRCRLAQAHLWITLPLLALTGLAILAHTGERPQLFSFLYLSLLFLLLDLHAKTAAKKWLYAVPPLVWLWANTHGGVVFGVAALGVFGAGYVLQQAWNMFPLPSGERAGERGEALASTWLMLGIVAASAVALVLAPNGITTFKYLIFLEHSPIRDRVSEYATPWAMWPATRYYWLFFALALGSLLGCLKKMHTQHALLIVVLAGISLTGYRYIPLFALLTAPYVAANYSRLLPHLRVPVAVLSGASIALATLALGLGTQQQRVFQHGVQDNKFPAAAVQMMQSQHLHGRMFNTMNWGGYLIWHSAPAMQIFIDGRMLEPDRVIPYTHILWMSAEGQRFFEQGNFDYVLIPPGNAFSGERYPLVNYLLNRPDWRLIQHDANTYFFARQAV